MLNNMKKTADEIVPLLLEVRRLLWERHSKQRCGPDPMQWSRMLALKLIAEKGNPTMQEIAHHLRITAPSATSIITHLEKDGWIERQRESPDKRIVRVKVSAKGSQELAKHKERMMRLLRGLFETLPEKDARDFVRILKRLLAAHRA